MAYQSVNPYDGKILKTFKELTDKQLETALGNAATCFEDWRHTTFAWRAAVVTKAAAITLAGDGATSLFHAGGTSVVIHEKADDMKTDPAGNAGARIACGMIQ
jgi:acyl-CoA reductase-like NAD-dependent aldehyde dehydrogenase